MQKIGVCSATFCNSTFLSTSIHNGNCSNYKNNAASFLPFPFSKTVCSSSLPTLSQSTHFLSLSVFSNLNSNKLRVFAFKKGKKGGTNFHEMDGSDGEERNELDFDDELDSEDEDEDMFIPLENMKKWLENKPRGFGEGKVYDTFIEDKLFEEMMQSKQAQVINVNNLKNNPVKSGPKKDDQKKTKAEVVPSGIRVRVVNLPKKKNIHRDLKIAFNGVSGIINISPAVSGNKKTKDPVCKGFAFIDFKREEDATRFVKNFSGLNITFGRVQKQIKCEMMNSLSQSAVHEELGENGSRTPQVAVPDLRDCSNVNDINNSSSDLSLETVSDELGDQEDVELDTVELELVEGGDHLNVISEYEASDDDDDEEEDDDDEEEEEDDDMEQTFKHATVPVSSNSVERIRALEQRLLARFKQESIPKEQKGQNLERLSSIKKKPVAKGKQKRVPKSEKVKKLDIPGSAKRLKIKEKAVLTGVFSKYGLKTATPFTSNEES